MPRRIEETVAENRSGRKRLEGYAIEVSSDATRDYVFTGNTVEVTVGIEVYTRPLRTSFIMGHPDAARGMGRGEIGDHRGDWTLVTDTEETGEFTSGGRGTVVDALAGGKIGLAALAVGSSTTAAGTGDSSLGSRAGSAFAFGMKDASNVTRARAPFLFSEFGDVVTEYGVEDQDGGLMSRLTTTAVDPTSDEELKVEVAFEFNGDGIGSSVITDAGEKGIADAIKIASETVGLYEVALGTGTTDPQKSDTSLNNEQDRKRAERETGDETVRGFTKWYKSEPSSQPLDVSELGVFDFDGNLVWFGTFDPFEKTEAFPFQGGAQIRII
jgi:hypothetical protein